MTLPSSLKSLVLYADDDPEDLQLVQEAFTKYIGDVDLVTCNSGMEALSYLKTLQEQNQTPCLIILDVNMPQINGKETLKMLRNIHGLEDVPVILFTTSSLPLDKEFARRYNAGFITKPIDVRQMELITEQFIEHCTDEVKKKLRK